MCGIAGILEPPQRSADELARLATAMATAIAHRGPDDAGVWVDAQAGVALGHRRLSIIDLSPLGHQPMVSASGRTVLVFNGEIYNHHDLRADLEAAGRRFRGRSDTEVLVEAIDAWGVDRTLARVNGMFAFAVWDAARRTLTLARDRLGEKPLAYGRIGERFVFASELKALRTLPGFDPPINDEAVALLLQLSFIPAPRTIHRGIATLPPGTTLTVTAGTGPLPEPRPYWRLADAIAAGAADRQRPTPADAVDRMAALLDDAVRLRMEADVPMGAFLSGGVDSSLVAALARRHTSGPLRTFTVAMPAIGFDESAEARAVADHLGTAHTTVELSVAEALDAIPRLAEVWDEPFADPSMLPTLLLCRTARQQLTVSLSGDGGDEVFAGYNRYVAGARTWARIARVPAPARRLAGRALLVPSPRLVDAAGRALGNRVRNPGDKVQKLARLLGARHESDVWQVLSATWPPGELPMAGRRHAPVVAADGRPGSLHGLVEEMLYTDTVTVLPDNMLVKVDRASMAASLEVRVPLLDHRVVEASWRLPVEAKIRDGTGKWLVRQVLRRHVPDRLIDRPKMGFDPPIGTWLRGPLRPWAEDLLAERRLRSEGWLDPAPIRRAWDEHQTGRRNWDYRLWAVLMFQAWLDRQQRGTAR